MRVILHDYDHARAEGLFSALPRQGLTVEDLPKAAIESGMAGLDEGAAVLLPVLLGLMPERDAAGQVRRMRAAGVANPLLVLQDDLDPDEVARILDAGADDDVGAPFAAVEIAARLRSVTRRHHGLRSQEVRSGALTVYLDGRHPEFDGQPIRLSSSENTILRILALNSGKVVRRDALFDALYALADYQPYMKALDVHICKLRKKIEAHSGDGASMIRTYTGKGYALEGEAPVAG